MYAKHEAIDHGKGKCMHCGRNVERILVGDRARGGNREWRVVDRHPSGEGWLPHTCPTKPDSGVDEEGCMSLARNHPHPDLLQVADDMRKQLHEAVQCCANHACEAALITAFSLAADVAQDDPVEAKRFIDALSTHIFRAIQRGEIQFVRPPKCLN